MTVAGSTLAARTAEAQRGLRSLENDRTLKIAERNSTRETRGKWSEQRLGSMSLFEGVAIDSVLIAREDSLPYVQKRATDPPSWRIVRSDAGRAQLVAIGRALPAPDDSWRQSRQGLSRFGLSRQDSVANMLAAARRFLENAAMFEDAPTLGTVREADVQQKWHSLNVRLEFTGRRTSTRVRDSTGPDGVQYAIVRDQATFDIMEVQPRGVDGYSAGGSTRRDSIHATRAGTRVVSLATARTLVMWDTTTISTRRVRRDIDGIELPSRIENRQTRVVRWESEAEWRREMASSGVARPLLSYSPPFDSPYERMRRRDTQLRDSVRGALAKPLSFSDRNWALGLLKAEPGVVITRRWEDSIALAAGDTAWIVKRLVPEFRSAMETADTITTELWRLALPFMRQRRYAWDRGIDSWELAGAIIATLSKTVPAFTNDPALWPCDSVTCELIAREYQPSRADPISPAAEVGLAMRALLRPAPWADSVLAHESDAPLLRDLRDEITGNHISAPAPDVNAPWRDWMFWKYGVKSDSAFARVRQNRELQILEGPRGLSAASVLRWRAARTGVDYGSILKPRYAAAVNDTERVVFAMMLNDLDLLRDSLIQVSALLSSNKAASQTIGRMQLDRLRASATEPDSISLSEVRAILIKRFTRERAERGSTWQQFLELPSATVADSAKLADAGVTLVSSNWQPPKGRSSVKTRVVIKQLGPLVWITYDLTNVAIFPDGTSTTTRQEDLRIVMHRAFDFWHVVDERYY